MPPVRPVVLAVDGGATKTEAWLVDLDGMVRGRACGAGSNHQLVGVDQAVATLQAVVAEAWADAGFGGAHARGPAAVGAFCLAGLDFDVDASRLRPAIEAAGLAGRFELHNDTVALLRAGTTASWGVATVCGTGLNCCGLGPDGTEVRFPSLGELSGDQAPGGLWLGTRALGLALRAGDGRGKPTALRVAVSAHFGLFDPEAVLLAVYTGALAFNRLPELARVACEVAAAGDEVAVHAVDELAAEVVAMTTACIARLHATDRAVEVVLGGGIFGTTYTGFLDTVTAGILARAPAARLRRPGAAPVVGAALLGGWCFSSHFDSRSGRRPARITAL